MMRVVLPYFIPIVGWNENFMVGTVLLTGNYTCHTQLNPDDETFGEREMETWTREPTSVYDAQNAVRGGLSGAWVPASVAVDSIYGEDDPDFVFGSDPEGEREYINPLDYM